MATGDIYAGIESFVGSDTVLVQPTAGNEVTIHNLWYNGTFSFYISDGTTDVLIDSVYDENDGFTYLPIHIKNDYYIKITETGGVAGSIAYDGIVTKTG